MNWVNLGRQAAVVACLTVLLMAPALSSGAPSIAKTNDGVTSVKDADATPRAVIDVTKADRQGLDVTFSFDEVAVKALKTKGGTFVEATFPGSTVVGPVGAPAVPVLRKLIEVPAGALVTVASSCTPPEVIYGEAAADHHPLMPIQAPIPKIPGAIEAAPFERDLKAYAMADSYHAEPAVVEEVGTFRGRRLFVLEVRPVAYYPAAGRLEWCQQIDVSIRFGPSMRPVPQRLPLAGLDRSLLNPSVAATAQSGSGNYLIIVADDYASAISSFATAKAAQGYDVDTYSVSTGTTNTAIKTYIESLWGTASAPDYILLVGDTDKIPHWTGGGDGTPATDLPYTCMDAGDDWSPDIAIGRFPVRSVADVNDVVEKTLLFEDGPLPDPSYLGRAVFMASTDNYEITEGTHDWTIDNYMDPEGLTSTKLYTVTYSATTQQVSDAFNAGQLFGIYSGHGGEYSWADGPAFSTSNVNSLTNTGMYPFVCSFACVTGTYTLTECFTETWMLKADGGAAAIWGSSVNSYWHEDDVLQKELFKVFYDVPEREIGPAITTARANFAVLEGTGSTTRRYFEMYNLMGDPSLALPGFDGGMMVTPAEGHAAMGPTGGPFSPPCVTYDITNTSDSSLNYSVSHDAGATWATLSGSTGGTLGASATVQATLCTNAAADALSEGDYTDTISFTNLSDAADNTTRAFDLHVGSQAIITSTDVPKTISDNSTVSSTLEVTQPVCITDLNVSVDISHTYIGDLVVELTSPVGVMVTLHSRSGGTTDDLVATYDDEGLAPSGPGTLADFDQSQAVGTWTLTIHDQAGGDTGTLNSWSLTLMDGDDCNDKCVGGDVVCTGSFSGSTADAAVDGASSCGSSSSSPDRWYRYRPMANGTLTLSTCDSSYDTVLSVHSACPATADNELACNDDDSSTGGAGVCGGGTVSSLTYEVTAGTTYYVRVSGWNGASGAYVLDIDGPSCDGGDVIPPTPNPMTFATPPVAVNATSITMTATTATDVDSPPVSYAFAFVSGGAGGTSSGWQSSTEYTDTGLAPNTQYAYQTRARDSSATLNETGWSSTASVYTLANTPAAPALSGETMTTMDLDIATNGNPSTTVYAVRCMGANPTDATWNLQYVNASGYPSSTAVWQTDAAWAVTTVRNLNASTQYTFAVRARNGDLIETSWGPSSLLSTIECNGDADCSDGQYCTGTETCDGYGVCHAGSDPCPGQSCDETGDVCFDDTGACCLPDGTCDDALSEAECAAAMGTFDGISTTCPTTPPCTPVDTVLWGELSSTVVAIGGQTTAEVFMEQLDGMRGYQIVFEVTRLSGTGTLSISCPEGLLIDDTRPDFVFAGAGSTFSFYDCPGHAIVNALPDDTVDVGAGAAYLGEAVFDVSLDAELGSTFEISFFTGGVVNTELTDFGAIPQPYRTGAPMIVTVGEAGACCLPDGSCDDTMTDLECWEHRGAFHGLGTTCPTDPPCAPVDTLLTCQAEATTVPPGHGTTIEVLLEQISNLRGYQLAFEITRTSGSGTLSLTCPEGMLIDQERPDYVFAGEGTPVVAYDCVNESLAGALLDGAVDVGSTAAYLGEIILAVSPDAAIGSTFEVSLVTGGLVGTQLTDPGAVPLPFNLGPVCTITVGEVGACCLPDGTCVDALAEFECWDERGAFSGLGTTCPTDPPCTPVDATMWCELGSTAVPAGGTTPLDVYLDQIEGVRGYQLAFEIRRLSGTGTVSITCPGGVLIDELRSDYIFAGQSGTFVVYDCPYLTMANALAEGTVTVGSMGAYLGHMQLEVSGDATDGSEFEISFVTGGAFGTEVTDEDALPMQFNLAPSCVLTVGEGGACCLPDGSCVGMSEGECDDALGEYRGTGSSCPPDPECVPVDTVMHCSLSSPSLPPSGGGRLTATVEQVTDLRGYQVYFSVMRTSGSGSLVINCGEDMSVRDTLYHYVFRDAGDTYLTTSCPDLILANALQDGSVDVGTSPGYLAELSYYVSEDATFGTTFELGFIVGGGFGTMLMDPDGYPIPFYVSEPCVLTVEPCTGDVDCLDGDVCTWDSCDEGSGLCTEPQPMIYADITGPGFPSPPNGVVNLDDIICALNAFGNELTLPACPNADIHPCDVANGVVNLSDIINILNAFGAPGAPSVGFACDCPLNP